MNYKEMRRKNLEAHNILDLLRKSEPVLKNPEGMTEAIMAAITQPAGQRRVPAIFLLQRLLAAASVALVLLFGYEQYIVVEKVSTLEKRFSEIKSDPRYAYTLYFGSSGNLSKAGISFPELEKLISTGMLTKQITKGK
jgi:cytochrome c-type biogenesis protein CcmH/NrfG